MRDEKGKITFKSVWKWLRSDQGKKYSFVIFYAIFFIFLFIFISMPSDYKANNEEKEEEVLNIKKLLMKMKLVFQE